jgi:hypothetical protein
MIDVATYERMLPSTLKTMEENQVRHIAELQSALARIRKAQKNQKRAAKDRNKVVG